MSCTVQARIQGGRTPPPPPHPIFIFRGMNIFLVKPKARCQEIAYNNVEFSNFPGGGRGFANLRTFKKCVRLCIYSNVAYKNKLLTVFALVGNKSTFHRSRRSRNEHLEGLAGSFGLGLVEGCVSLCNWCRMHEWELVQLDRNRQNKVSQETPTRTERVIAHVTASIKSTWNRPLSCVRD